jgi:hypothetical protein
MLEIANLSHTYSNGTVALEDVSLSIPRGMYGLRRQVDADANGSDAAGANRGQHPVR